MSFARARVAVLAAVPLFPFAELACSSSDSPGAIDASTDDAGTTAPDAQAADAPPDESNDPRVKELRDLVTSYLAEAGVPGAAFAVISNGKLFYAGGVGVRKAGGHDPVDADTLFRGASLSKMTVAAAIESLAAEGKIDVTRPITEYVAGLALQAPFDASTIAVEHLLSHTAALPDIDSLHCAETSLAAWFQAHPLPLWAAPGAIWDYSNTNFDLAALAIERITSRSYADVIHDRVFVPAGMTTATFDQAAAKANPNHAVGSALDAQGALVEQDVDATSCVMVGPAGGLIASVTDFAHLVEAFLANGGSVMPAAEMTDMETPRILTHDLPGRQYAFGLMLQDYGGETLIWHSGDLPGYHAELGFLPAEGVGIVAMVNGDSVKGSVADATLAAGLSIFARPPHAPATPTTTTPESEWTAYVGAYKDPYGSLGDITVSIDDAGALEVATSGVLFGGISGPMTQVVVDEWQMPNGTLATFWRDDGGVPGYFVTRSGVGVRQ